MCEIHEHRLRREEMAKNPTETRAPIGTRQMPVPHQMKRQLKIFAQGQALADNLAPSDCNGLGRYEYKEELRRRSSWQLLRRNSSYKLSPELDLTIEDAKLVLTIQMSSWSKIVGGLTADGTEVVHSPCTCVEASGHRSNALWRNGENLSHDLGLRRHPTCRQAQAIACARNPGSLTRVREGGQYGPARHAACCALPKSVPRLPQRLAAGINFYKVNRHM